MIKTQKKIRDRIYNSLYFICNFYRLTAFKKSDNKWFRVAVSRTGFKNRPYLEYASYSHYLKLNRIVKVVDEIENWTRVHGKERNDVNILDVGCGWAAIYSRCLASLGYNVTGIDLDGGSVISANELTEEFPNIRILQSDADEYIGKNNDVYEIVLAADVLEHMKTPEDFCRNVFEHISSPGLLLVIVPDGYSEVESLYLPVAELVSKKLLNLNYFRGETHIQRFSLKRIERLMIDSGFNYKFCIGIFSTRIPFLFAFIFGFRSWPAYMNIRFAEKLPGFMTNSWFLAGYKERHNDH